MSGTGSDQVVVVELVPAPPSRRPGLERPLSWVFTVLGGVGILIAVAVVLLGLLFVDDLAGGAEGGLSVTSDVLDAALDTIDTAEALLESTAETLGTVDEALQNMQAGFEELDLALEDMSGLVGGDLAESIEELQDVFPGLVTAGESLDVTLGALAVLGLPYDPEQSLAEAFREVDASLQGLPEQLRAEGLLLESARGDVAATGSSLLRISANLASLRTDLFATSRLFARYRTDVAAAKSVVVRAQGDVETWRPVAIAGLVVLGVVIGLWQLVPIHLGWRLRRDRPRGGQRRASRLRPVWRRAGPSQSSEPGGTSTDSGSAPARTSSSRPTTDRM